MKTPRTNTLKSIFFISAFFLKFLLLAAIIPHQGRITVQNQPFNGVGYFKFALVDQSGIDNTAILIDEIDPTYVEPIDFVKERIS